VKNKAPAEIQITAEQLLREAKERDLEIVPPVSIIIIKYIVHKLLYFTNWMVIHYVITLVTDKNIVL